jgi:hypothetical protein
LLLLEVVQVERVMAVAVERVDTAHQIVLLLHQVQQKQ